VPVDEGELASLPSSVVNVAAVYGALRDDIVNDTVTAPTLVDAERLAHLVDDIGVAAADGCTTTPNA
jgi:hypothetical protein